jgi:hypothetical protein
MRAPNYNFGVMLESLTFQFMELYMISGHSLFFCAVLRSPKYSAAATRFIPMQPVSLSKVIKNDFGLSVE